MLFAHPGAELYGSDRVGLESVGALLDAGWRVVVTVPDDGPLTSAMVALGARVVRCPTLVLRKALLRPRGLVSLVRQTVGGLQAGGRLLREVRPSVVYVNTVTVPLWIGLARLRRIPVLCHVHEAEGSAPRWVRWLLAVPLHLATTVIANSDFSIQVLASSSRRLGRRTRLLPNGVPGPATRTPARLTLDGPVRLVYLGRLSPRKGVDVAVSAVAALRDRGVAASLAVVGAVFPGYEWFQEQLADQVRALDLTEHVTFHGFQDSVWPIVGSSDVVVVPSRVDEPFGNTAVEALLCARPVVASATSGLLEATAGAQSARTVEPGNPVALARAIEGIVHDWTAVRAAAWEDAGRAAERHSPELYRAKVAATVEAMAPRVGARL
jgi:glycosyltransferase involved in cell wall biosynthesis